MYRLIKYTTLNQRMKAKKATKTKPRNSKKIMKTPIQRTRMIAKAKMTNKMSKSP